MLIAIPDVLTPEEVERLFSLMQAAEWIDGNATSGASAALAKRNQQLPEESEPAHACQAIVSAALARNALFLSAALPSRVFPPLFSQYGVGDVFHAHVDNAIRVDRLTGQRMRTDMAATLFLADIDQYDGGELVVEGSFGSVDYKLPAGHLLLYPATSLHRVNEITRGKRLVSFFWIESMVRDEAAREMLFDLDQTVQALTAERGGDDAEVLRLTHIYHNLVRRWAQSG